MAKKRSRPAGFALPRSKVTRTSARPQAPKRIHFPIDKLPVELVHMICVYLKPTDLASLRLVSRLAAPIGLEYIAPEAHLLLVRDNFDQLKALSEHPVASKYVTSFFFEADRLGVLPYMHWEPLVSGPEYIAQVREMRLQGHPCHHATERTLRTYNRGLNKLTSTPRHRYTKDEMDEAFRIYSEFLHFQQDSKQRARQEEELAEALKRFPNIKQLTLATQSCTRPWTSKLLTTYRPTFCTVYDTDDHRTSNEDPPGLQQMRSLLLGAYHAGLKVETLNCGLVSWRILNQGEEIFIRMMESVSNVKRLRMDFATGHPEYDNFWLEPEIEECSKFLQAGRLQDFITAAPNLEHLHIGFQSNEPTWATQLKYVVGDHHWPSLKSASFTMIGTSEDDLVAFCSRHAGTLKSLRLDSVGMIEGDWFPAFTRMRKILKLDTMEVAGRLEGPADDVMDFEMGSIDYCPELQDAIEAYLEGPCSEDDLSLDDFLEVFLPNTDVDSWSDFDDDTEDDGIW